MSDEQVVRGPWPDPVEMSEVGFLEWLGQVLPEGGVKVQVESTEQWASIRVHTLNLDIIVER